MPDEGSFCNVEDEDFAQSHFVELPDARYAAMASADCLFCFAATKASAMMVITLYLAAKSF
jgi:hypothetical protein